MGNVGNGQWGVKMEQGMLNTLLKLLSLFGLEGNPTYIRALAYISGVAKFFQVVHTSSNPPVPHQSHPFTPQSLFAGLGGSNNPGSDGGNSPAEKPRAKTEEPHVVLGLEKVCTKDEINKAQPTPAFRIMSI